jgi:hypothetical protein
MYIYPQYPIFECPSWDMERHFVTFWDMHVDEE